MGEDFRILNECTVAFKKDKLYVMLLRELGEFGVEVTSKNEGLGRKFAKDKTQANELFDAVSEKLLRTKGIDKAEKDVKSYFALKDLNEILFLLKSEDVVRSQISIGDLYVSFKFRTKTEYDTKGTGYCLGAITIYIYFNKRRKPIGRFIGTRFGEDFIFERLF